MQNHLGCPARPSPFSHYKKKKGGWWGKEDANLGLRLNLCLFYLITQALFMFTPSHLAISQTDDVSNWKAWNTLERSLQRNSHTFTYLGWVPNGKKKKACFGRGTKELPLVGLGSFGCFMAFNLPQSFLEGPGVKSEDRYMGDSCQDFRGCLLFFSDLVLYFIEKSFKREFCMINFVSR